MLLSPEVMVVAVEEEVVVGAGRVGEVMGGGGFGLEVGVEKGRIDVGIVSREGGRSSDGVLLSKIREGREKRRNSSGGGDGALSSFFFGESLFGTVEVLFIEEQG